MADLAIDDEDGGEVDEAEVGRGAFLPANEQPAEAVEPTVGHLHHPAPRRVPVGVAGRWQRRGGTGFGRDVGAVATGSGLLPAGWIVVPTVQRQLRRRGRGRL